MTLDELLSPLSVKTFMGDYLGKRFLHMEGTSSRFESLFSWQILNDLLNYHRAMPPRKIHLYYSGEPIAQEKYTTTHGSGPCRQTSLLTPEVTKFLGEGATLVVNGVDKMCNPLSNFAKLLEGVLKISVGINVYAAWRAIHGFNLHYDNHDVFILQVTGAKRWKVYEPTVVFPCEECRPSRMRKNAVFALTCNPHNTESILDAL